MLLLERNVISEMNTLSSTAVTLTASGERRESHVVFVKEIATKCPDVMPNTTAVPVFPRKQPLVAPSSEPELKVTATLVCVLPSDPKCKVSFVRKTPTTQLLLPLTANKAPV